MPKRRGLIVRVRFNTHGAETVGIHDERIMVHTANNEKYFG